MLDYICTAERESHSEGCYSVGEIQLPLSLRCRKPSPASFHHKCPQEKAVLALRVARVAEAVCVNWEKSALVEEGTEPVSVKKAGAFDWDSCPSLMGHTGLERAVGEEPTEGRV